MVEWFSIYGRSARGSPTQDWTRNRVVALTYSSDTGWELLIIFTVVVLFQVGFRLYRNRRP